MSLTTEQISTAAEMWKDGKSSRHIAAYFGVSRSSICGLAKRRDWTASRIVKPRLNVVRKRSAWTEGGRPKIPRGKDNGDWSATEKSLAGKPLPSDYLARLAEIPPDTRTLTARLMGDPLPSDTRRQRHG